AGRFAGLRRLPPAALDPGVADAVAGVDHVGAAVAVEAVFPGLAEHAVGAPVADQDVVVEGALHVLVGAGEVDFVAALDHVDAGGVAGEGEVEGAGGAGGLGEGGAAAAGAADQGAAGAASPGGEQVAVGTTVEVGGAGHPAAQPVGPGTAVEVVGS